MKYKQLGKTGLMVSGICLGTLDIGGPLGEEDSIKLIKNALDLGINFIDTANVYRNGKSEEYIGKAIKGVRDSCVISTKVRGRMGEGVNDYGLSRKHIMKQVEDSLRRLQTDYIDIYYIHNPHPRTAMLEALETFDDLVRQGKVLYTGCSNYTVWELCKMLNISDMHGLTKFSAVEPPYNLLCRDAEVELLPCCEDAGIGVCVYSPMASEMLSGRHEFGKTPEDGRFADKEAYGKVAASNYWTEVNFKAVDQLKKIAADYNLTMPQFALGWVLNQSAVTAAISGPTTLDQLKENCTAADVILPPEALRACDEVWSMFRPPRLHYAVDGRLRKVVSVHDTSQ